MKLVPTHYFSGKDLEPFSPATEGTLPILPEEVLQRIEPFITDLCNHSYTDLSQEDCSHRDLLMFAAFLELLGIVKVKPETNRIRVSVSGPLANDAASSIFLLLRYGFSIFDDWWRRFRTLPDQLCALEFLHHMELQRIEHSKRAGIRPEVLHEIPVAFAVIKAYSEKRRQAVFLLELNKDWNRYNLIGGKDEPHVDKGFRETLFREIEEELGVMKNKVQLTQLTEEPLEAYSLSGHKGVLSKYPCMLYLAHFTDPIQIRAKDKWVTEEELLRLQTSEEPGLMINPIYLEFLFNKIPGGLKGLDYSFKDPVEKEAWYQTVKQFMADNKEWIVALLAIIGGIITVWKVIFK